MSSRNLNEIFKTPTLHVLRWNLYDVTIHQSAMNLVGELFSSTDFRNEVMPLIRPIGRGKPAKPHEAFRFEPGSESYGDIGSESIDYEWIDLGQEGFRSSHCELWLQVSDTVEQLIWERLRKWIDLNKSGTAERSMNNALGRPFGQPPLTDTMYAKTRFEFHTKRSPTLLLSHISEKCVPKALKVIWFRSTESIVRECYNGVVFKLISAKDKVRIVRMLADSLASFDLNTYSIPASTASFNPIPYIASHMPAFAINATTVNRPDYELRKHYKDLVAWPSHCQVPSLSGFMSEAGLS